MARVFAFSFGGIFIVLAIGMFIHMNFNPFVEIMYWLMIFGFISAAGFLFYRYITAGKAPAKTTKIVNANYWKK